MDPSAAMLEISGLRLADDFTIRFVDVVAADLTVVLPNPEVADELDDAALEEAAGA